MNYFWIILLGMTAGWLAGQFMTGKGFGMVGDIVTGIIGAIIGGIVFQETGILPGSGLTGSLIVAAMGATSLLYGVRWFRRV